MVRCESMLVLIKALRKGLPDRVDTCKGRFHVSAAMDPSALQIKGSALIPRALNSLPFFTIPVSTYE